PPIASTPGARPAAASASATPCWAKAEIPCDRPESRQRRSGRTGSESRQHRAAAVAPVEGDHDAVAVPVAATHRNGAAADIADAGAPHAHPVGLVERPFGRAFAAVGPAVAVAAPAAVAAVAAILPIGVAIGTDPKLRAVLA